jgi:hypothetical protein
MIIGIATLVFSSCLAFGKFHSFLLTEPYFTLILDSDSNDACACEPQIGSTGLGRA